MSNITVVTSITGGKDDLLDDQCKGDAKWVAYLEKPYSSNTWEIKKACDRFRDDRRNSRIHKIAIHQYVDTEYSIWIDGNLKLLKPPEEIVERYLKDHDFAVFFHSVRDCIYDEAITCAKIGAENAEVLIEQVKTYEDRGFAKHKGLCECGFLLRRNTPKVEAFNNAWWSEYCRFSKRDQISFMYAAEKAGLRINVIKERWYQVENRYFRSDFIELVNHLTPRT
jgi:hypothetical protein